MSPPGVRAPAAPRRRAAPRRSPRCQPASELPDGPKDAATATELSIAGTLVGPAMFLAGALTTRASSPAGDVIATAGAVAMLIGPSAGHWYAGEADLAQMGVRTGGMFVGLTIAGLGVLSEDNHGNISSGGMKLVIVGSAIGLGTYVGSVVYDIATSGAAARRYDRTHGIGIAPMIVGSDGHVTTGVTIGAAF